VKIKIKTKEEFKRDGSWDEENNAPFYWNFQGEMDYLFGKTFEVEDKLLDKPRIYIDGWALRRGDYIVIGEKMTVEESSEYPIYKKKKDIGYIVKFAGLQDGEIAYPAYSSYKTGQKSSDWIPHTNTDVWEDVYYDRELDLWDKQLVWCWNNYDKCAREVRFFYAKNKGTYWTTGEKNCIQFDNYEAYEGEWPKWAKEAYRALED
jgi:hypothetical protein